MSQASDFVVHIMDAYIKYYLATKGVQPPAIHLFRHQIDALKKAKIKPSDLNLRDMTYCDIPIGRNER